MPLFLFDTHVHLDTHQFDSDRAQVIDRALQAGVKLMVNPAVDFNSSEKVVEMAQQNPHIYAAVGIHPQESSGVSETEIKKLYQLTKKNPRVVAIGETGLDYYRNGTSRTDQFKVFEQLMEIAGEMALPIIIHSREAERDTLALLEAWIKRTEYPEGKARGVIHCFSGSASLTRTYTEMGFYIAVGGYITFPSSKLTETICSIPVDRLLIETDCPYLAPQGQRGKRNEPAFILETATFLAGVLQMNVEELGRLTTENGCRLFGLNNR